ncbi:hypothetical protein D3X11_04690 [Streptococcus sp. X16XC17]|uniref:hypothetical protein n=1 Tax=unclassified Streptococcus TaxID=2608887 RepID=UPI00066FB597|nr:MULTISPECIES: hypothetical protein [unclassified Streptococcus]TCD46674.1 hypothetical protein D3X11_04690 [Streptococcus sp. X16XC17]
MKKDLKFDFIVFIFGAMVCAICLMMLEKHLFEVPYILLALYFIACLICFSFIMDYWEEKIPRLSLLLRLVYLVFYFLAPIIFFKMWQNDEDEIGR